VRRRWRIPRGGEVAELFEEGLVVAVAGAVARVRVARSGTCGSCASRGSCNPLGLAEGEMEVEVDNLLDAHPGQRVVLALAERQLLKGALWFYVLPLATFFAGYGLAARLGLGEGAAILAAFAGLSLGGLVVYVRFRSHTVSTAYRPQMVRVGEVGRSAPPPRDGRIAGARPPATGEKPPGWVLGCAGRGGSPFTTGRG